MSRAAKTNPILQRLHPAEHAEVLGQLLVAHPDLRDEAERAATVLLERLAAEDVATRVTVQLGALELGQLADRAGRVPGGYVEPTEADLHRCIELGLPRVGTREAARTAGRAVPEP